MPLASQSPTGARTRKRDRGVRRREFGRQSEREQDEVSDAFLKTHLTQVKWALVKFGNLKPFYNNQLRISPPPTHIPGFNFNLKVGNDFESRQILVCVIWFFFDLWTSVLERMLMKFP